jgi:ribosomal protein L22
VAQLTFNPKKCSEIVRRCLNTVRYSAENNYGLNPDRLVVSTSCFHGFFYLLMPCAAEASVGRQTPRVKPLPQGRGHSGWETKPFSQLRIVLREMPQVPGEIRLGKWGKEAKFKTQQTSPAF